jgi:hypothetical protein
MRRNLFILLAFLILTCAVAGLALFVSRAPVAVAPVEQPGMLSAGVGKPEPIAQTFEGCPPSGDGGDPVLNTLKNRVDEAQWQPTTVQALLDLTWPQAIEGRSRSRWSQADAEAVSRHEGTPVQVEGYLVQAKKMSPETCNCHSVQNVDYHIWLVDDPQKGRERSVVIETTPRVQSVHYEWTLRRIQQLARDKERVRISGWLLMDPEHPDQIGKTRGTIWEIHPVMQIETFVLGQWTPLDGGSTGVSSAPAVAQTIPPVTPASTASQPPAADTEVQYNRSVQISDISFDGTKSSAEPDEYVEVTNLGSEPVDITDWELQDTSGGVEFKWENFVLQPGISIRVYTNETHGESGGFSFDSSRAIWANSGDVAELYDADKQLISRYAYGNKQ